MIVENASKALIIAGAILLAILLISLGIMVFTQAQDAVTNSGMSEAEITAFNNKFLKYEGNQKGTMVKALIQEVLASNASTDDAGKKVKVNDSTEPKTKNVVGSTTDSVIMGYSSGRVTSITVFEGANKTSGTKLSVT